MLIPGGILHRTAGEGGLRAHSVELAESNYRVVEQRYQNDIALITDMVDAANQLLDAELQLSISRINILMRYYQLMATVGIL